VAALVVVHRVAQQPEAHLAPEVSRVVLGAVYQQVIWGQQVELAGRDMARRLAPLEVQQAGHQDLAGLVQRGLTQTRADPAVKVGAAVVVATPGGLLVLAEKEAEALAAAAVGLPD
jgi:hypothetical protein